VGTYLHLVVQRSFYYTSSLGSSNEDAAQEEELQAIALQKRMAATLQEEDFEVAQLIDSSSTTAVKPAKSTASDPVSRQGKIKLEIFFFTRK